MKLPSREFGIYVKTHRPDYHLAKALISSLREFIPEIPIIVVPDDGYRKPSLWGEESLLLDDPFLDRLDGFYKKLWVFFGPFRRFIYLDADMLAMRDPRPLIELVRQAEPPFFMVCSETKVRQQLANGDEQVRKSICQRHIGDLDLLRDYDSQYDPCEAFPFNSGFFATHQHVFDQHRLMERFESAVRLQREHGLPPLTRTREGVFMGDQGFLNYMAMQSGARLQLLDDVFVWGGVPFTPSPSDAAPYRNAFVHWAGCPRPSLFGFDVPAGERWLRHYLQYHRPKSRWRHVCADASRQAFAEIRTAGAKMKKVWRKGLSS